MRDPFLWLMLTLVMILGGLIAYPLILDTITNYMESPTEKAIREKLEREDEVFSNLDFELSDPEEAPEMISDNVMMGYGIMINTRELVKDYIGSELTCSNCHFAGGNTLGGKNGGLSLAGVSAVYPKYDARFQKVMDLPERINNCFVRSMNGKPLPRDSKEMLALTTYLQWISKGLPIYKPVPWLGLTKLETSTEVNATQGKQDYAKYCSICHGDDGQGTLDDPALWGDKSYNDEAGMNQQQTLEAFIYHNMPLDDPSLNEQEARDIAAFIIQQPRPILKNREHKN